LVPNLNQPDGTVNPLDISAFSLAVSDPEDYESTYPDCDILNGDIDGDGDVDNDDNDDFVALLTGGGNSAMYLEYTWDGENRLSKVEPAGTAVLSTPTFCTFVRDFSPLSPVAIQHSSPELLGVRLVGSAESCRQSNRRHD